MFQNLFFIILSLLISSNLRSQIRIEKVRNHKIQFSYENLTSDTMFYFNPECFFFDVYENDNNEIVTLFRHRANLRNDTLFIFLHDIDFLGDNSNSHLKNCIFNKEKFIPLFPNEKRSIIIKINKKIPYKYLSIYGVFRLGKKQKKQYFKVNFNRKKKYEYREQNIQPEITTGKSDKNFNLNGTDFGLGYRWYPKRNYFK